MVSARVSSWSGYDWGAVAVVASCIVAFQIVLLGQAEGSS